MEDLFYLLYKMALTLKEEEEISSEVKPHLIFLRKILFTNHTKKLRRRTKGNIVHTYHAMNFYILWILKFLENEEISQLFRERSGLLEEIREIEMELFKEERKKNQLEGNDQDESGDMGDGKEEPSSTQKGLSSEGMEMQEEFQETQGDMDEEMDGEGQRFSRDIGAKGEESLLGGEHPLAQDIRDPEISNPRDFHKDNLDDLNLVGKKIEELQKRLESLKDKEGILLEEYEKSLEEIDFEEVTEEAVFLLEELDQKIETMGTSIQEMRSLPFDFIIKLSETLKDSMVEQLIKRIGRTRKLARSGQRKRKKKFKGIQSRRTLSDDIHNITEDEYLALGLGIEALELDFYDRFLNARLSTWEGSRIEKKRKGPIIVCYDGSASMEGERILEAKAHLFAFMDIAKKQKRKILAIQFSSQKEDLMISELEPYGDNIREMVDIIEGFIGKGTDFEKPLLKSLEYIHHGGFKDADIIFMTDGESQISESFKVFKNIRRDISLDDRYSYPIYKKGIYPYPRTV